MKRGQLTLMIITGIVLLFAVGMVIWLGNTMNAQRTGTEAEQQRLRQLAVQPVRDYVQSCLDVTTSAALELLGKQGGVLYRSQGGLTADPLPQNEGAANAQGFVRFDGLNASYVILRPTADIGTAFLANPPDYPFRTFPYFFRNNDENAGDIVATQQAGYFGVPLLPPLLKPGNNSIQEQLESSIAFNLPRCARWENFRTQGLAVSGGIANVTVLIAENVTQIATEQFFSVIADWPVTIRDLTTGGETTLSRFSLGYPVHLAKFYLFLQTMVINEVSNASYDPRSASTPATPVSVEQSVFTNADQSGDDVIIAQDAASQLRGRPLEFRLPRKNRYPALLWVNQTDLNRYRFIPAQTCDIGQNQIFLENRTLTVTLGDKNPSVWTAKLNAIDPDEDEVTFKTCDPAPTKISVAFAGQEYRLDVFASDVGRTPCGSAGGDKSEDWQVLRIQTADCPRK